MKINDRYEIRVVILEIRDEFLVGDVYDNFEKFRKDKPDSDYDFGYVVFDTEYGYVPDECNDWNDSPEDAMLDYEENCCKAENEKVDKIASFFEKEENWTALKDCWLENGRSSDLRRLLQKALTYDD